MIPAKIGNLKDMFQSHFAVYNYKNNAANLTNSHRLLLFYAVECGLKALILKKIGCSTTESFARHSDLVILQKGRNGHDIEKMLHFLGYRQISLPKLPCLNNKSTASPMDYNQVWRYGIDVDLKIQAEIVNELEKIAKWIGGKI